MLLILLGPPMTSYLNNVGLNGKKQLTLLSLNPWLNTKTSNFKFNTSFGVLHFSSTIKINRLSTR
jgi:hypothetical protein